LPIFRSSKVVQPNIYYGAPKQEHKGNQIVFHRQTIKEYIKEQQLLNEEIVAYVKQFNEAIRETKEEQAICNESIFMQLSKQDEVYNRLIEKISKEENTKEAIIDSLASQMSVFTELSQKVSSQEKLYNELLLRIESQDKLFKKLAEKLELQEVFHESLLNKLEQQEAANFKVERKIDSLKESMFERFASLTEKVESNLKQMIYVLLTLFRKQPKQSKHSANERRVVLDISGLQEPTIKGSHEKDVQKHVQ